MRRNSGTYCSLMLLSMLVGCKPSASPSPSARQQEQPEPATAGAAAVPTQPTTSRSAEPEPRASDSVCAAKAYVFDAERGARDRPLADLLARTELVAVAPKSLWQADCSGIGWRHFGFSLPVGAETVEVYRRAPVHDWSVDVAPFALVGARRTDPKNVSLGNVCIEYSAEVGGTVDWIYPLPTAAEASAWEERLAVGACGRPATPVDQ